MTKKNFFMASALALLMIFFIGCPQPDTPLTPSKPTSPTALTKGEVTDTTITITWTAPDGGADSYDVYLNSSPTAHNTTTITATTYKLTGLTANTEYSIKLQAKNSQGESAFSSPLEVTTLPPAPTALTKGAVTDTNITITWTAPVDGADSYDVYLDSSATAHNAATPITGLTYELTGLTANKEYSIKLKAKKGEVESAFSSPLEVTTLPTVPTALTKGEVGETTITITWTAPDGGADSYDVYLNSSTTAHNNNTITATTYKLTGLTANKEYSIKLQAKNSQGESAFSSPLEVTTLPPAPTALTKGVVTETSISISWTAPTGATNSYDVYLDSSTTPENDSHPIIGTTYTIENLTANTEYSITLKAKNGADDSGFSPVLKVTTLPTAPTALTKGAVTDKTLTITWTAPDDGADSYDVYLNSSTTAHNNNTITATTYKLTGLTANKEYSIKLQAKNSQGDSDFSSPLEVRTARIFNALRIKASGDEDIKVMAHLVKTTNQLEIYLQEGGSMSTADINHIATNFKTDYPTLTDIYGTHSDVDRNNNKTIILLYGINENPNSPNGYVAGYFSPADLFAPTAADWTAQSNEAEMLYVESEVSGEIKGIYDTVIHEFQHLINFNMNVLATNGEKSTDLWLNEALSESTAIVKSKGKIPLGRLATYNDYSNDSNYKSPFHTSILAGNYFYNWDTGQYVLADYATASLFMYWLYLNSGDTNTIFHDIAQATSTNRGSYNAVLEAVGNTTGSLDALTTWQNVLFAWLEANENESLGYPNGNWIASTGQTGAIALRSKVYGGNGKLQIPLFSGDAMLTVNVPTTSPSNDNIVRKSFSSNYWTDGENGPALTVNITLNKNTVIGADPIGINVSVAPPLFSATRMSNFSRMSDFPVFVGEKSRIIPRSQTPLPAGAFE